MALFSVWSSTKNCSMNCSSLLSKLIGSSADEPISLDNKLEQFIEQFFVDDHTENNAIMALDKIFFLPQINLDNLISHNEINVFYETSNSITNSLVEIIYDVVDAKNPIILLLVPLVGYILIRSAEEKFEFNNFKKILSFSFALILILSAVTTPFSISHSYWGTAYAEQMNENNTENPSEPIGPPSQNSDVPSNHMPQSSSDDASNAPKDPVDVNSEVSSATESIDTSVNQANAPLPDNSTIPSLPDNSTIPSLPDNSTIPSLPDNSTIPSLPDNSTIPSLPDNST